HRVFALAQLQLSLRQLGRHARLQLAQGQLQLGEGKDAMRFEKLPEGEIPSPNPFPRSRRN
ncbi:hypothetical protein, partial [Chromobacterium phragmitis]